MIKNYVEIPIKGIRKAPWNYRLDNPETAAKLAKNIARNGQIVNIIVRELDTGDFEVINGNHRLDALHEIGEEKAICYNLGKISDAQAKRIAVETNETEFETDQGKLADLINAMVEEFDVSDLQATMPYSLDEMEEYINMSDSMNIDDSLLETMGDNQIQKKAPPVTKKGDLWELGDHRILCGDSTKKKDIEKLMNTKRADMLFTDPPYLMDFKGSPESSNRKPVNAQHEDIINDKLDAAEAGIFLSKIALIIKEYVKGSYYLCFYRLGIEKIINALIMNGLNYRSLIIWHKNNLNLSGSDYQSIYEPIVYGWNEEHNFYGSRSNIDFLSAKKEKTGEPSITTQSKSVYLKVGENYYKLEKIKRKPSNFLEVPEETPMVFNMFSGENDIWEINKVKKNDLHPTMKPIELCEKAIINSSRRGNIVLDLFLGSGSTLVASEKTGRICYAMELGEHYCDVSVIRYKEWCQENGRTCVIKLNGEIWN